MRSSTKVTDVLLILDSSYYMVNPHFISKMRTKFTLRERVMEGRKARILVIDDDEGIRRVLSTVLEDAGHLVDTAKEVFKRTLK
jgi:PleD family two-component response regulator